MRDPTAQDALKGITYAFSCLSENYLAANSPLCIFSFQEKDPEAFTRYIERFATYCSRGPNLIEFEQLCLIARFYMLKFVGQPNHRVKVDRGPLLNLFYAAFSLAQKLSCDDPMGHPQMAHVAGVAPERLAKSEWTLFECLDHDLQLSADAYNQQVTALNLLMADGGLNHRFKTTDEIRSIFDAEKMERSFRLVF